MSKYTNRFVVEVEKKITPREVGKMAKNSEMMLKLPQKVQRKIIDLNQKNNSYMGFVVEPYSFFFAYEITEDQVSAYLPDNYELVEIALFEHTRPRYCAIVGCFNIHTSVFWGTRVELYIIAKNKQTNLVSWLICDYESNTYHYDPGKGFIAPTTDVCVFTTTYAGELLCELQSSKSKINYVVDLNQHNCIELNQRLWIEGNLSIDYSGTLDNAGKAPFGLIFDPMEMKCAQHIPDAQVSIKDLSIGFIQSHMIPFECCCFPFAQHYLTTVFPEEHTLKDAQDLERKIKEFGTPPLHK
ncbi:MAG: hypothetical protein ACRCZJ_04600 [Erysipelotrichaceae bacterium]